MFTRALASGAEIVRVSRSSATVDADPKFAAMCRVSTSPATRTCAAYPSRARPSMDCANASRSSSGIFQKSMVLQRFQGGARDRDFGLRRVQNGVHPHTKNPSPDHRQSPSEQRFSP